MCGAPQHSVCAWRPSPSGPQFPHLQNKELRQNSSDVPLSLSTVHFQKFPSTHSSHCHPLLPPSAQAFLSARLRSIKLFVLVHINGNYPSQYPIPSQCDFTDALKSPAACRTSQLREKPNLTSPPCVLTHLPPP